MRASIRADLYETDLLILGTNLATGETKPLDPIMWEVEGSTEDTYILVRPFPFEGERWAFDSIDLEILEAN